MNGYNMPINGQYYNPLTAQAIAGAFNTKAVGNIAANTSGIYDYANNASIDSIANNAGMNGALNNFDPYSMNYNLGSGMGYGMGCGMGMGMGMGFMGYGPGSEIMGMTQADYLRYQENMQNQQIDMQTRQRKKLNTADYVATAGEKAVKERIGILHDQIARNNQDNVMAAYISLKTAVGEHLKNSGYVNTAGAVDEEFQKAYTNDLYEKVTGRGIPQDLRENGDSYFVQGLKQGFFGLGFASVNRKNRGDNASAITGTPVTQSEKGTRWIGRVLGGLVTIGAAVLLFKGGKALPRAIREFKISNRMSNFQKNLAKAKSHLNTLPANSPQHRTFQGLVNTAEKNYTTAQQQQIASKIKHSTDDITKDLNRSAVTFSNLGV